MTRSYHYWVYTYNFRFYSRLLFSSSSARTHLEKPCLCACMRYSIIQNSMIRSRIVISSIGRMNDRVIVQQELYLTFSYFKAMCWITRRPGPIIIVLDRNPEGEWSSAPPPSIIRGLKEAAESPSKEAAPTTQRPSIWINDMLSIHQLFHWLLELSKVDFEYLMHFK